MNDEGAMPKPNHFPRLDCVKISTFRIVFGCWFTRLEIDMSFRETFVASCKEIRFLWPRKRSLFTEITVSTLQVFRRVENIQSVLL